MLSLIEELIEKVESAITDWDGRPMNGCEEPRVILSVDEMKDILWVLKAYGVLSDEG